MRLITAITMGFSMITEDDLKPVTGVPNSFWYSFEHEGQKYAHAVRRNGALTPSEALPSIRLWKRETLNELAKKNT